MTHIRCIHTVLANPISMHSGKTGQICDHTGRFPTAEKDITTQFFSLTRTNVCMAPKAVHHTACYHHFLYSEMLVASNAGLPHLLMS